MGTGNLRAVAATFACAALIFGAWAGSARADARVTIALFGDSVAEGYTVPGFARTSLVPQLRDALVRRGFARGGAGLIPAMPDRWSFTHEMIQGTGPVPPGGWRLWGVLGLRGFDGPSGYSAVATTPTARASVPVGDPEVGLLFGTTTSPTPFVVRAGSRIWPLDAQASGRPHPTERWLDLPPGTRSLTVSGPSAGRLTLNGVVGRRPVPPGRVQVEVNNLAHAGHMPHLDLAPRIIQAVAGQRYDVSVFLWSYISELLVKSAPARDDAGEYYEGILLRRARLARASGGLCVIADSSPMPVPAAVARRFTAIHARVARRAGCVHTSALGNLWSPRTARRQGLVLSDDTHPTAAGYRLMARALAPVVARVVRQRADAAALSEAPDSTKPTGSRRPASPSLHLASSIRPSRELLAISCTTSGERSPALGRGSVPGISTPALL